MSEPGREPETLAEGTLISHLLELRDRLLRATIAVAILSIPCVIYADELFEFIARPLMEKLPSGASMIATNVIAPFMAPFKLAIVAAVFLAMPYVLYQAWAFVAPGLYRHEKRFALPLLISSIVLFYGGVAFAYYAVFPAIFAFFATTGPTRRVDDDGHQQLPRFRADAVLRLRHRVRSAGCDGTAGPHGNGQGRDVGRANRGYVLIGIFVIAAFLTPPDAISQCIMAVPMYLLYEIGIVMSRVMLKAKLKRQAEEEAAEEKADA